MSNKTAYKPKRRITVGFNNPISFNLNKYQVRKLDRIVQHTTFGNRSELIRWMIDKIEVPEGRG